MDGHSQQVNQFLLRVANVAAGRLLCTQVHQPQSVSQSLLSPSSRNDRILYTSSCESFMLYPIAFAASATEIDTIDRQDQTN